MSSSNVNKAKVLPSVVYVVEIVRGERATYKTYLRESAAKGQVTAALSWGAEARMFETLTDWKERG